MISRWYRFTSSTNSSSFPVKVRIFQLPNSSWWWLTRECATLSRVRILCAASIRLSKRVAGTLMELNKVLIANYTTLKCCNWIKIIFCWIVTTTLLKIANVGIGLLGLKVWCSPGISKITLILAFFRWSHSHSKLDLKSFVFIDVSLVMATNIIRIRATIKNYDWSYVASIWIKIFIVFKIRKLIITSQEKKNKFAENRRVLKLWSQKTTV